MRGLAVASLLASVAACEPADVGAGDPAPTPIPAPPATPAPVDPPVAAPAPILADGRFEVAPFDTGNITGACVQTIPWGGGSWGIDAETFTDPTNRTLAGARFVSWGHQGYLFGREDAGRWGFVRYIQGDMWGGGNCGPILWNEFAPVATYGHDVTLGLNLWRDQSHLLTSSQSWVMYAINVWFSSPDLPKAGGDKLGKKPIVMDLIFHHECNFSGCGWRSYEDAAAYHYQAFIGEAPQGGWSTWVIPLDPHLRAAFQTFGLPDAALRSLALYQAEFLIELRNADAAATVDDYVISVR